MPFYFDLSNAGAAADADARQFVVAQRKELGGGGVPTPPVLLMNAKGQVLGEVSNYATPQQVLDRLVKVLKDHPEYNQPSEAEKKLTTPTERAELAFDLHDFVAVKRLLEKETGDPAHYLLGRTARFERNWDEMEKHLAQVSNKALAEDVRVERSYRLWNNREFEKLRDHLKDFPKSSRRYTEARYMQGLASYHLGDERTALAVWKETIQACPQDPWIYRADWAYTEVKDGNRKAFSTVGPKTSLLNRIGYMGRPNPDLQKPK